MQLCRKTSNVLKSGKVEGKCGLEGRECVSIISTSFRQWMPRGSSLAAHVPFLKGTPPQMPTSLDHGSSHIIVSSVRLDTRLRAAKDPTSEFQGSKTSRMDHWIDMSTAHQVSSAHRHSQHLPSARYKAADRSAPPPPEPHYPHPSSDPAAPRAQ